jgi:hypothetical protein
MSEGIVETRKQPVQRQNRESDQGMSQSTGVLVKPLPSEVYLGMPKLQPLRNIGRLLLWR